VSDDKFIVQLNSGDEDAFKKVIDMYQKKILKIAYGYTNNLHDSDDIAQDVFITLYHNLSKIVSMEHLKLLIYRITVSRSLDFLRKNRFRRFIKPSKADGNKMQDFPDITTDVESDMINADLSERLLTALNILSNNQKTVFMLKNHEGLTIKEIAKVANMGESTVKTHLFRAVRSLKTYMEKNYAG
jgi:RNA polymerase sigma-70 factor (ECF subfamily)